VQPRKIVGRHGDATTWRQRRHGDMALMARRSEDAMAIACWRTANAMARRANACRLAMSTQTNASRGRVGTRLAKGRCRPLAGHALFRRSSWLSRRHGDTERNSSLEAAGFRETIFDIDACGG
jgi:hypothetical protein